MSNRLDRENREFKEYRSSFSVITKIEKLQKENKILKDALELVAGMCGNPDAVNACRLISKKARAALEKINKPVCGD